MADTAENHSSDMTLESCRDLLGKVEDACRKFDIISLRRSIEVSRGLLTERPVIDVAVLGQFKAGKSSFLNSIIGRPVLPVGVIPVTTVITRLQYGDKERAVVTTFDGSRWETGIEGLEEFISEARNPANEKNVEAVDIDLPSLRPYVGLRVVDTPGLGSAFTYNTETSREWLPRVGTAIVAISADRPLAESDIDLIRNLMGHTPKVVLLLTKADLLSEGERKEVMQFFKTTLKRVLGLELPMFMYSTTRETDAFKRKIDHVLLGLSRHRDLEFQNILEYKVGALAKGCAGYLEIALRTATEANVDRRNLRELIINEKVEYEAIEPELSLMARENMLQTRTIIAARLEMIRSGFTTRLVQRLTGALPSWKGNLWQLTRTYEEWLEQNLVREVEAISEEEHIHFFGTLKKTRESISRSLELFRHYLNSNITKVLGVTLEKTDWKMEVTEPSHAHVVFIKTFDFHLDLVWFMIPMFIFRKAFERHFLKKIPRIAEIHLSRLAYQWEVRINDVIEEMKVQALRHVREELSTIESLLSESPDRTEEILCALDGLRAGPDIRKGTDASRHHGNDSDRQ